MANFSAGLKTGSPKKPRTLKNRIIRPALTSTLSYFKIDEQAKRKIVNAYNKYQNATTYNKAQRAATEFTNGVFMIINKESRVHKNDPIGNGIANGVAKSVAWWLPGIVARTHTNKLHKFLGLHK